MSEKYPNLTLRPPLFYNWNIGIKFELGDPEESNIYGTGLPTCFISF